MAAEIIVIVEDQNPCVRVLLAKEIGGGKAADPPADNDQIIGLPGVDDIAGFVPALVIANLMGGLE